jgi:hypothetical protein
MTKDKNVSRAVSRQHKIKTLVLILKTYVSSNYNIVCTPLNNKPFLVKLLHDYFKKFEKIIPV